MAGASDADEQEHEQHGDANGGEAGAEGTGGDDDDQAPVQDVGGVPTAEAFSFYFAFTISICWIDIIGMFCFCICGIAALKPCICC